MSNSEERPWPVTLAPDRLKRGFEPTQRTQRNKRKQREKRNERSERNWRKKRKLQPIGTELSSFQLNSFLRLKNLKKNQ